MNLWLAVADSNYSEAEASTNELTILFDSQEIVRHEYAPAGQIINKEAYRDILQCLREAFW